MNDPACLDGESWPSIGEEELHWSPDESAAASRRQRLAETGPYSAAVVPPIADIPTIPLPAATLTAAEEAAIEIARFDAESGAAVVPFLSLLLRSESASSSKIEHLTASAKAIALAELGATSKRNDASIVANTRAMEAAIALADEISPRTILAMHSALMTELHPNIAGQWRTQQVWIGGGNYGPRRAEFVPPHHRHVPSAIDDLAAFLQRDDLPPLIQATIGHAQFETIHPFPDGNGRVGRSLMHASLRAKRLTRSITVPISAGLLVDTDRYFQALTSYRQGDLAALVDMMVGAVFIAIDNGRHLVTDLAEIRQSWNDRITVRQGATAWRLADQLMGQPVIDSAIVQRNLNVAAPNANSAIEHLAGVGILKLVAGNLRKRKWAAHEVLSALDDFAERAGRRNY